MLLLSRKPGESIFVGENVKLTITHASKTRVRVLLEAPRDVKILRGELERDEHDVFAQTPR